MKSKNDLKKQIKALVMCAICLAMLVLSAWVTIPFAIPFTLQTMALTLIIAVLGGELASCVVICYFTMGIIGLPVFAGFGNGIATLVGPTGGYLIGFLLWALLFIVIDRVFKIREKKTFWLIIANVFCLILLYSVGTMWFVIVWQGSKGAISFGSALMMCVVPYIIPDVLKISLACVAYTRIKKTRVLN
ncbi:MAG: biotin transporter BioY [Saccharofermentanaceae bacterium]|jgi:biotin transport system substrate-specific component|nr:biotin transporter BioY [Clostridia bacterium]NLX68258.1 biotin transporter BioY [Clostridiaceae bacterium]HOO49161.1 biotin transporter BioY [Saccharofermentans sp.]HPE27936.1 biotin transporter BioY [Saccharofermentans sp.]HPJ81272.1 biotin transporter BioY [Saccharofermentans sp.]